MAYAATGACLGTGVVYTGGAALPDIRRPTNQPFRSGGTRGTALVALLPAGVSATDRSNFAAEIIDLVTTVESVCTYCTIDVEIESMLSGAWPGDGAIDWNALRTSTEPAQQPLRAHFLAAEVASDAFATAINEGAGTVDVDHGVTYRRASTLAEYFRAVGLSPANARQEDWHAALQVKVIVSQVPVEDLSAR